MTKNRAVVVLKIVFLVVLVFFAAVAIDTAMSPSGSGEMVPTVSAGGGEEECPFPDACPLLPICCPI